MGDDPGNGRKLELRRPISSDLQRPANRPRQETQPNNGKDERNIPAGVLLLHHGDDSQIAGRDRDQIPEHREAPGSPQRCSIRVIDPSAAPVTAPEPRLIWMAGLKSFLFVEFAAADPDGGSHRQGNPTEGHRTPAQCETFAPVASRQALETDGEEDYSGAGEGNQEGPQAAQRHCRVTPLGLGRQYRNADRHRVSPCQPVSIGVSLRPPHSLHAPSYTATLVNPSRSRASTRVQALVPEPQ